MERFDGPQFVEIEFTDAVGDIVVDGLEELDLHGPGLRGQFLGNGMLGRFVVSQNLACAFDDRHGKRGQASNLDTVAFVGGSGFDLAEGTRIWSPDSFTETWRFRTPGRSSASSVSS